MAKVNFKSLDKLLPATPARKGSNRRRVTENKRHDRTSEILDKCNSASEIANLAMKFGFTEHDIRNRAKAASGFGQFRMVMGNLIRGVVNRISRAKRKGQTLSVTDAAYPKKAEKAVKKVTKKKAERAGKAKKTKKAKKK